MKFSILFIALVLSITLITCTKDDNSSNKSGADSIQAAKSSTEKEIYTCPMHPSVISDRPGACPVCGMALVKKSAQNEMTEDELKSLQAVTLSPTQRVLANITTELVARRTMRKTIEAVGVVEIAEPLQVTVTARFRGRMEKLFVNFSGDVVKRGQALFEMYSPDLLSAQQDFIIASKSLSDRRSQDMQRSLLQSSRSRLKIHFGMTEDQIQELERTMQPVSPLKFHSPVGGTVLQKNVQEGQYVDEGTTLYEIADLSRVWVVLEVYEKDFPFVKMGQTVDLLSESFPGERFSGQVKFIDPIVNPESRTIRIRTEFDNPILKLRPKMYVRASIVSSTSGGIVIPAASVIITGRGAVVWVENVPNAFEPRAVILGSSSDSYYEILSGLSEGETIATTGAYLIDSESQLQSPTSPPGHEGHVSSGVKSPKPSTDQTTLSSEARILVKGQYKPSVVRVKAGPKVKLHFYRDEDADCSSEVIFDDFNIHNRLPARETTTIELLNPAPGRYQFTCGMAMIKGTLIVVQE